MSDSARRPRTDPRDDIDISTSASGPTLGWRGHGVIWGTVLVIAAVVLYLDLPIWWILVATAAAYALYLVAGVAWVVVVKRGAFTWMPLALKPSKLRALGDPLAAEAAFAAALERARRFADLDHRRGLMLCELAMYVKLQGRMTEALALYEESTAILAHNQATQPFDYFVVLNNYGICFIHLKDYERAQRILEQAIDLSLTARKREAGASFIMRLQQVQLLQFVLHLNLAFLLMEMNELAEAELQLREADALAPMLSKRTYTGWHDHYHVVCAHWESQMGKHAAAEAELADVRNQDYPPCLRERARLHLARREFIQAEQLLRKYQEAESKKGTLHIPDKLKPTLEFADSMFGQKKVDDAFAALQEARAIVADFKIPADGEWRAVLTTWLQRAKDAGRPDLARSLEDEIARIPVTTPTAVTILEKIRARQR
ncbi:MAG: tetratricopeptide repeat protein [Planctomycetes bacterium]|nr:tetratricopeptide repeat protein [Planctomycetota bacterium]